MENGTLKLKKSDWTKYEHEFYNLCVEKKWFVQQDREDGSTYLESAREDKRGLYRVYSHGPGLCGIIITAEGTRPAATKNSILKKMIRAKIITGEISKNGNSVVIESPDLLIDGEGEAIAIFKIDRLARAVKTLNLRKEKKKEKEIMSAEDRLAQVKKEAEKEARNYLRSHYAICSEKLLGRLIRHADKYGWQTTNNDIVGHLTALQQEDDEAYHDERLL